MRWMPKEIQPQVKPRSTLKTYAFESIAQVLKAHQRRQKVRMQSMWQVTDKYPLSKGSLCQGT